MKKVAIIQARLTSTRLPGKVLLPLGDGRSVLEHVVGRAHEIAGIDLVGVAIPERQPTLRHVLSKMGESYFLGSEDDVLARYHGAAKACDADIIMRLTADCPFFQPTICAQVLGLVTNGVDYASNVHPRTMPRGWDCEVFTRNFLDQAHHRAHTDYEREHVTPWMWKDNPFTLQAHLSGGGMHALEDCTIDTPGDYERLKGRSE